MQEIKFEPDLMIENVNIKATPRKSVVSGSCGTPVCTGGTGTRDS